MVFELESFQDETLQADYVAYLVDEQADDNAARLGRLWDYFRNELTPSLAGDSGRPYAQAQEVGLPPRITGAQVPGGAGTMTDLRRKEVVVENDIAWRIGAMNDFLFGKPPVVRSLAADARLAGVIERCISAMLDANGGVGLLQEMALFGAVYGFVDVALRTPADGMAALPNRHLRPASLPVVEDSTARRPGTPDDSSASEARPDNPDGRQDRGDQRFSTVAQHMIATASRLQLETIESPRVLPILDENDYRRVRYWVQCYRKYPPRLSGGRKPWYALALPWPASSSPSTVEVVEIIGPAWWQRYEGRRLVAEGPNALGRIPVVHIQNMAMPGSYEGLSDVEPLIPLQDELNTRLSDRANRVTYQSFKMYLGKGIDDFLDRPVGPGQMWATQNLSASIEEFGSDDGSPSEDAHIEQVRLAMDKASAVTPLAAGLVAGNVGNLTSATALKVVLSGLLARTARKRLTYGQGLMQIIELALGYLDLSGVLPTSADDRRVEIHWPSPLPADEGEQLRNAQIKAALGVPSQRVLAELGYDGQDQNGVAGIQ